MISKCFQILGLQPRISKVFSRSLDLFLKEKLFLKLLSRFFGRTCNTDRTEPEQFTIPLNKLPGDKDKEGNHKIDGIHGHLYKEILLNKGFPFGLKQVDNHTFNQV